MASAPTGSEWLNVPSSQRWGTLRIQTKKSSSTEFSIESTTPPESISPPATMSPITASSSSKETWRVYDPVLFNLLDIDAKSLATQMAIVDFRFFVKIQPAELLSLAWTGPDKWEKAPNVVIFTQRFNNMTLWTSHEILESANIKRRADKISHFINIAKGCYDVNNFHGLKSIMAGLQSTPVHRLSKTWALVGRKDKTTFDKLAAVMSADNNSKHYRKRLANAKPPCIPFLGLHLSDLTFIHEAAKSGTDRSERDMQTQAVLDLIKSFQQVEYDYKELPAAIELLSSAKFIAELQPFYEDENYRVSLQLEPKENSGTILSPDQASPFEQTSSSPVPLISPSNNGLLRSKSYTGSSLNHSSDTERSIKARTMYMFSNSSTSTEKYWRTRGRSEGDGLMSLKKGLIDPLEPASLNQAVTAALTGEDSSSSVVPHRRVLSLIDDSMIEKTQPSNSSSISSTLSNVLGDDSDEDDHGSYDSTDDSQRDGVLLRDSEFTQIQGKVIKKDVMKDFRKARSRGWRTYWAVFQPPYLLFFRDKPKPGKLKPSCYVNVNEVSFVDAASDYKKRRCVLRLMPEQGTELLLALEDDDRMNDWILRVDKAITEAKAKRDSPMIEPDAILI